MKVLGIDPGTATTGYGLIQINGDKTLKVLEFGLIETHKDGAPEMRLKSIYKDMLAIVKDFAPDELAMEMVFFATNAKTAIRVGQAQGVILLAAATNNLPIFEYAPGTIKKLVSGDGRSDKKLMQKAVRRFLGAKVRSAAHKKTHFDNAADALAVAICHAMHIQK